MTAAATPSALAHINTAVRPGALVKPATPPTPAASPLSAVVAVINHLIVGLGLDTRHPAAANANEPAVSATVVSANALSTTGSATVPLQVYSDTEPLVDISIDGGPTEPVLVDTGSEGLVVGLGNIGLLHLFSMGLPTGIGVSGYSGGLTYLYATFKTTVNFGNGIVTAPTSVDVALLSFPQSFASYSADDGATGVLGIGPNASGPGPSSVIAALPGNLSDGVLIDEPDGVLVFGPNPLSARASVSGAPNAQLQVKIGSGQLEPVSAIIDSGGVYGTVPSSLTGNVPAGTVISVYSGEGQTLLYSYTTDQTNTPTITSDDLLNTGYEPFAQQPVYFSYSPAGVGTTTFDYL
ncbi:hypothetical protein CG716_25130 [Mycolicibacterium sphagni]|uniref:PE cleavage protein A C-terminal domain-containing protein n=1 Tax=Mycolicibacterium sphagni TaxID=1786 RepID=A0A255DA50_9MYCO|nr:hypothetical protein CG716_25130 [Mycolicibacterium sphagni]